MSQLISQFPQQIVDWWNIASPDTIQPKDRPIHRVYIAGMWWSAIWWSLFADLYWEALHIPLRVCRAYTLPAQANMYSLVVITSYSWNTEETVSMMLDAVQRGCHVVVISSWWTLQSLAKQHACDFLQLPAWIPPRACMAVSFGVLLWLFKTLALLHDVNKQDIDLLKDFLLQHEDAIKKQAHTIAQKISPDCIPIIYVDSHKESVAIRFRQQINENSKMLCRHHVFPEMNHNELLWREWGDDRFLPIFLCSPNDHERVQLRMRLTQDFFDQKWVPYIVIDALWDTFIQNAMYLVYFTDWVSSYVADKKNIDAVNFEPIEIFKKRLGTV